MGLGVIPGLGKPISRERAKIKKESSVIVPGRVSRSYRSVTYALRASQSEVLLLGDHRVLVNGVSGHGLAFLEAQCAGLRRAGLSRLSGVGNGRSLALL